MNPASIGLNQFEQAWQNLAGLAAQRDSSRPSGRCRFEIDFYDCRANGAGGVDQARRRVHDRTGPNHEKTIALSRRQGRFLPDVLRQHLVKPDDIRPQQSHGNRRQCGSGEQIFVGPFLNVTTPLVQRTRVKFP